MNATFKYHPRLRCRAVSLATAALVILTLGARAGGQQAALSLTTLTDVVSPGHPLTLTIELTMPEGWHTYWVNPGESGMAPDFRWTLPTGVTLAALQYPVPQRFDDGVNISLGYTNRVHLLADFQADQTVGATATIGLKATWMICRELCLPVESKARVTLRRGPPEASPGAHQAIDLARRLVPCPTDNWQVAVTRTDATLLVRIKAPPGIPIPAAAWPQGWLFPLRQGAVALTLPPVWTADGDSAWTAKLTTGLGAPASGELFEAVLAFPERPLPAWHLQAVVAP